MPFCMVLLFTIAFKHDIMWDEKGKVSTIMNEAEKRLNDNFQPIFPNDDIVCKDCVFRKPDLIEEGKAIVKGYKNGYCKVYTKDISKGKPNEVLFEGKNCKYYIEDAE